MSRDGSGSTELESSEVSPGRPGSRVVPRAGDENTETYWQSDGGQPHLINIQFHKKMSISEMAFYLDYGLDESYTPKKMSIRAGTTFHDLVEVEVVDLHEPTGWVTVALWMACCAYIIAVFQAVPVSLHFQVSGTLVPTPVSQFHLGMGLAVFRIFTFLCGSPLGILSNRFGRR